MNLTIRASAQRDIFAQMDWYLAKGQPAIAQRLSAAVERALRGLLDVPDAGSPCGSGALRSLPVKGFADLSVYCVVDGAGVSVVRVLHDKRDLGRVLGFE